MIKKSISNSVHKLFNLFGLEIRFIKNLDEARKKEKQKKELEAYNPLAGLEIKSILDIGANEGQFANTIRSIFPAANIYSFEPLPDAYEKLRMLCLEDSRLRAFNLALGNDSGIKQMFKSSFSPSSSMLPMLDLHKKEWPDSSSNTIVEINSITLDDWIEDFDEIFNDDFLVKLDVQGYELLVIQGGINTIKQAKIVLIEVCFYEFYENQPLFDDVYNCLRKLGFEYRGNLHQFISKNNKKIIFADAIFENVNKTQLN